MYGLFISLPLCGMSAKFRKSSKQNVEDFQRVSPIYCAFGVESILRVATWPLGCTGCFAGVT